MVEKEKKTVQVNKVDLVSGKINFMLKTYLVSEIIRYVGLFYAVKTNSICQNKLF
jgi:hypothetical protein